MFQRISNVWYSSLATLTVFAMSNPAFAGGAAKTVGDSAGQVYNQFGNVGKVAIAASFLTGVVMTGGGLLKLKQASESQGSQTPYSAGLWRVGLGAGLVALPALVSMMSASAGLGDVSISTKGGNF